MPNDLQIQPTSLFDRFWARLACWRGRHAPDRNRVRKDGLFYTGKCQTCGTPIRKRNGRPWKPYKPL